MAKENPTAGQPELRAFLTAVYDGLDLLAEQDLDRRFAVRERLGELLAERGDR